MAADTTKTVALALQGGGSHAAFTWGALDRLLDEVARGSLRIAAISGTSGGALNGAVCASGLASGPGEAKQRLEELWNAIAGESLWPSDPYRRLLPRDSPSRWNVDWTPLAIAIGMAEQIYSPYWNPWPSSAIGSLVEQFVPDFDKINAPRNGTPKLFVSATDVNRTALRVFGPGEITAKAIMASACYPTLYRAVEIDGSFYWDGGYMGNPALNPLVDCSDDLLTILINPLDVASGPPITPRQIVNRINELSFNSSWVFEIRQIELINQLIDRQLLKDGKYSKKRFHIIRNDRFMEAIGTASKQNPARDFVYELRDRGRQETDEWISRHFNDLGVRSSFNAEEEVALRLSGAGHPTAPASQ